MKQKLNKEFSAGTTDHSSTKDDDMHVSPAIGNTNVSSRLSDVMPKFGKVHDMIARTPLSKKEYQPISTLLSEAKVELYNAYLEAKEKNIHKLLDEMIKEENELLGKAGFYNQYARETHANNKYCLSIVQSLIKSRFPNGC